MTPNSEGEAVVSPAQTDTINDGRILHALSRWLLWPVAATVLLVIGVSFLLSFQSQTELAIAARIRPDVAWGWPIIVDGTIVIATFAALILQPRGRRVSWYPWANLILFGILSIYANGIHATNAKPVVWELFIIGAVPAVGLLVSTHMLVIMLGHGEHPAAKPRQPKRAPAASRPLTVEEPQYTYSREPVAVPLSASAPPPAEAGPEPAVPRPVPSVAAPAVPVAPRPAPAKPRAQTPKTAPQKKLNHDQVTDQIIERNTDNILTTGADIALWMGLSPARGARILEQIQTEISERQPV